MPHLQVSLSQDTQIHHELVDEKTTVGRVEDNSLCIEDDSVSSRHAEIVMEGDTIHLHDLGSTNGSFVNGEQVTDAVLSHLDEIRFGAIPCVLHSTEGLASDAQPLPESSAPSSQVAHQSARPVDFLSSSPIPKNVRKKDPVGIAAMVLGSLALVASAAALTMAVLMQG